MLEKTVAKQDETIQSLVAQMNNNETTKYQRELSDTLKSYIGLEFLQNQRFLLFSDVFIVRVFG